MRRSNMQINGSKQTDLILNGNYVSELNYAADVINGLVNEIWETVDKTQVALVEVQTNLNRALKIYNNSVEYSFEDPENYDGFDEISQSEANECYQAWDEYADAEISRQNLMKDLERVRRSVENAVNIINAYGIRYVPEE